MLKKFGRKFIQGAKAEIEENPPVIFDPERLLQLAETAIALAGLGILLLSGRPKKAATTVINNYYFYK